MEKLKTQILRTIIYADIFDYPLSVEEIFRYLIAKKETGKEPLINVLRRMIENSPRIATDSKYYFLKGRKELAALRKKREGWSREKIQKAKKMANLLKIIPTVRLVGISGALAMENSDRDDDIDLFIVTASGRLWLTRFLVTILVELTGQRRRPIGRAEVACRLRDKICLNMFIDEDHLAVSQDEQNLFTAHEVVQMKAIWWRDDTYQKFLWGNRWVKKYLPNSMEKVKSRKQKYNSHLGGSYKQMKAPDFLGIMEKLVCWVQLKYMVRRRTTEKIEPGRIMFHPLDKSDWVMKNYTHGKI